MSPPKVRQRFLPHVKMGRTAYRKLSYRYGSLESDETLFDQELPPVTMGLQYTVSEGHPWNSRSGNDTDIGGNFYTARRFPTLTPSQKTSGWDHKWVTGVPGSSNHQEHFFRGKFHAVNPTDASYSTLPPSAESSDSALEAKGATAIARVLPTNSVADTSTFLGELIKDKLPNVPLIRDLERRTRPLLNVGDEFLNVVFGWQPLVRDITGIANAINHASTVLRQFERDAGRVVRRRYYFDIEKSTNHTLLGNYEPYYGQGATAIGQMVGPHQLWRTDEISRRIWFSGAFTYSLPKGYSALGSLASDAEKAKQLLGIKFTPETLWELAPWSWAADWVTNAGDVVHNLSAFSQYGLVMRYGYIMETMIQKRTYTSVRTGQGLLPAGPSVEPVSFTRIVKKRRQAHPFGFGVTWEGLNPLQSAILAALGISRSR